MFPFALVCMSACKVTFGWMNKVIWTDFDKNFQEILTRAQAIDDLIWGTNPEIVKQKFFEGCCLSSKR